MKEYYVKCWGQEGDFLKRKLGFCDLDFWFTDKCDRSEHINMVKSLIGGHFGKRVV